MDIFSRGNRILVMNKGKIEAKFPGGFSSWENQNSDLIIKLDLDASTCTHPKVVVQLVGYDDPLEQFKWLKSYSEYICFEESYKFIESSHRVNEVRSDIDSQISIQIANLQNGSTTEMNAYRTSLEDLLKKIDFDAFNYEKLIEMKLEPDQSIPYQYKLDMKYEEPVANQIYYSAPFFRSIIRRYNVTDFKNCIFYFTQIKVDGTKSIGFKVSYYNNTIVGFYDYSTIPGSGGGHGIGILLTKVNTSQAINYL